jgi:hypothetical protein
MSDECDQLGQLERSDNPEWCESVSQVTGDKCCYRPGHKGKHASIRIDGTVTEEWEDE